MVITVTLNPILEHRYTYSAHDNAPLLRGGIYKRAAGGKGINVSRQLKELGIKNTALIFTGGESGRLLKSCLTDEGINFTSVQTAGETRSASVIEFRDTCKVQSFFSENVPPAGNEISEFIKRLEKLITMADVVIFSGSAPDTASAGIIKKGIELCAQADKISFIDTYGPHLEDCIKLAPVIVHNNFDEAGLKNAGEPQIIEYLKKMNDSGVKISLLTNGEKEVYASNFGFIYKIQPPAVKTIDATGCGDAFCAGIINGVQNSFVFKDSLKYAVSVAASNAGMWEVCKVSADEAGRYAEQIEVVSIGDKMNLLNV